MRDLARSFWIAGKRRLRQLPLSDWQGIRAGFIVSTGRTGTQRIAEVLSAVTTRVEAVHEPAPDLFHLGEAYARGEKPVQRCVEELRRARQPHCNQLKRSGLDCYVESNTNAGYLAEPIREVFDEPRFIHIVRDGRAVVRSLYSKTNPSRRPGQAEALFLDHDDNRCRLAAVDFPDDPWATRWPEMSRFERICWHWSKKNALIRDALTPYTDALVLKFEDIFDEGTGFVGFWELLHFLELEDRLMLRERDVRALLSTPSNRASRYRLSRPDTWAPELQECFERIAGAEQRRYYD